MDHYALATQMGTSVRMIEQHYGHMTPVHIAEKLAGPRMGRYRRGAKVKEEKNDSSSEIQSERNKKRKTSSNELKDVV